jgi:hypothetical protein
VSEPARGRRRRLIAGTTTVLAGLLVWAVLVAPERVLRLTPAVLLRIPIEALVVVAVVLALGWRRGRIVATVAGALLGVLAVVRILDLGFNAVLHRSFNPVTDWRLLGPGVEALQGSVGTGWADAAVVAAALLAIALPMAVTLATRRICRLAAGRRRLSSRVVTGLAALWVITAVLGAQLVPQEPVASAGAAELVVRQVQAAGHNLRDLSVFRAQLATGDPYGRVADAHLLTGLRGKDVVLVFVESYGRVAVQDFEDVRAALDDGTRELRATGFGARSAFLTSPTFGGVSWLAHATLQSGLWIDSQQRHDQLLDSNRLTLSSAFRRAGWRTVADVPLNRDHWPEGEAFYRFDRTYDRSDVGYAGPKFGVASMPDQYVMSAFEHRELGAGHPPVMAEIDLVSSHEPWTPLPRMVPWEDVGDGSIYNPMAEDQPAAADVLGDPDRAGVRYAESIRYTLDALVSWATTFHAHDDDLVLVLLGDHQPISVVSGPHVSHDVPISVVARDPAVLRALDPWHWDAGLLPAQDSPLWRMDAFRDRFLAAFGTTPPEDGGASAAPR